MVKVGENKKSRDDVDSGPMKEEKRWIFPPVTNLVLYVPYQAKEEIVGFCQVNPSLCLLPSWGGGVMRDVRGGWGPDLHVHGGDRRIKLFHFATISHLSYCQFQVPFEEEAYLAKQNEAKVHINSQSQSIQTCTLLQCAGHHSSNRLSGQQFLGQDPQPQS